MNMLKVIALMRLRRDILRENAKKIYEEEHVPLVMQLMPMIRDYRRNYLDLGVSEIQEDHHSDFDVITELWFAQEEDRNSFLNRMRSGDEGRRLRKDSQRFLQAGTTRMFLVQESITKSATRY
ncbi:hypothetical protein AWV79_26695 [Cupriavidus sp. UYMMa02A]|nr:hypothetical protein AWV79_26695 [Cupriavidus sp. UYMMa02A]